MRTLKEPAYIFIFRKFDLEDHIYLLGNMSSELFVSFSYFTPCILIIKVSSMREKGENLAGQQAINIFDMPTRETKRNK